MASIRPFLDVPIAHRGLHGAGVPENSLGAFEAACAAQVGVELDVHPLADGSVAVFHDLTLERMCGVQGTLADLDRDALRVLRLAGTEERIPTLCEALEAIAGRVPVMVELKQPATAAGVRVLADGVAGALRRYPGPAAALSFEPALLRSLATRAADIPRVQLSASRRVPEVARSIAELGIPWWKRMALEHLAVVGVSRPQMIGYDVRALPHRAVSVARRLGLPVLAGIVTTPAELAVAVRHGDGIAFEQLDPELVHDAWRHRGAGA